MLKNTNKKKERNRITTKKMLQQLFLINVEMNSVPLINKYQRQVTFTCIDENGSRVVLFLNDEWNPKIYIRVHDDCIPIINDNGTLEGLVEDLNKDVYNGFENIIDISTVERSPLIGFTNNRIDTLLCFHLRNISATSKLIKYMKRVHFEFMEDLDVYPEFIGQDTMKLQFLHESGLRMFTWFNCNLNIVPMHSKRRNGFDKSGQLAQLTMDKDSRCFSVGPNDIAIIEDQPAPMQMRTAFLGLSAYSSSATKSNLFSPSANIKNDVIQAIVIRIDDPREEKDEDCIVIASDDEVDILLQLSELLQTRSVDILAPCESNDIAYIVQRAKLHELDNVLAAIKSTEERLVHITTDEGRNKLIDVCHPGRLRLDINQVLRKFMTSPPLDSFSLLGALHHPKLVKNKARHAELESLMYTPPTCFSSLEDRIIDLERRTLLLRDITMDNTFIGNHAALSKACDMPLRHIVERGQTQRVLRNFYRDHHKYNIYVNQSQAKKPFVVVKMLRAETSFPDPPWIDNPPLQSLYDPCGFKRQQQQQTTMKKKNKKMMMKKKKKKKQQQTSKQHPWTSKNRKKNKRKREEHEVKSKKIKKAKANKKAYAGGYVADPIPGLYATPEQGVITFDFKSLYPSCQVGYKLCYRGVLYDRKWLDDPRATLRFVPLNDDEACVFVTHYDGHPIETVTDKTTSTVMMERKRIRKAMKKVDDPFIKASMNAAQLTCKVKICLLFVLFLLVYICLF